MDQHVIPMFFQGQIGNTIPRHFTPVGKRTRSVIFRSPMQGSTELTPHVLKIFDNLG